MEPFLYQINTRQYLNARRQTLATIPDADLDAWAARGFTHVWLMGVWPTGPASRQQAIDHPDLRREYDALLPGWTEKDVPGSPFAVASYDVDPAIGGDAGLAAIRKRLRARSLSLILDFIPNHVALDHPWARTNPERFVLRDGKPTHGKDPFFPAWTDTLQLDYRRADTRDAMTGILRSIAARCDGVRCDMAMLVLSDVFERTWGPPAPPAPEFWSAAIGAVRREHPRFTFIAEAYWGLERRLQELGFDYTYDKTLHDHLAHRKPYDVPLHIHGAGPDYIRRGVHFLENHDEPRAATTFSLAEHKPAAVLTFSLPGLRFIHEGQLEGARRFSRIQLARRPEEPVDAGVAALYDRLLPALHESGIGRGTGEVLHSGPTWEGNPTHGCIVAVQWQTEPGAFDLAVVNLAPHRAQANVRVTAAGIQGRVLEMTDRIGVERYERAGDEIAGRGLFLDVAEHAGHLYRFRPATDGAKG